jgi:hypothetical protein
MYYVLQKIGWAFWDISPQTHLVTLGWNVLSAFCWAKLFYCAIN